MTKQILNKIIEGYKNWRRNSPRNGKRLERLLKKWKPHIYNIKRGYGYYGSNFLDGMERFERKYGVPDRLKRTFIEAYERVAFIEEAYEAALKFGFYTKAGLIARRAAQNPGASYTQNHKVVVAFCQEASRLGKESLAEKVAQTAVETHLKKGPCEVCLTCNYENAFDIAEKTGLSSLVTGISSKLRNANRLLAKMGYDEKPSIRRPAFGGHGGLDYRQMDKVKGIIDGELEECGNGSYRYRFPIEKLFE